MADGIEHERFYIATETAHIRAYTRGGDPEMRPRVVSKLVFLDMLGENTAFGHLEAITLMGHDLFSYKRVGYISGAVLLDENSEMSVLVTQTLLKDLKSHDRHVQCLALAFIANVASQEICRAVASEVQKTILTGIPAVMKRAGMAIVRIVRKNPELADQFKNSVQKLLNHGSHGVIIAGMNMAIAMMESEPRLVELWSQFVMPFTKILKNLVNSRGSREYQYGSFGDPYMMVKTMKALALLKKPSPDLDHILQSIVTSVELQRNTGRAVFHEAVETIVALSSNASLKGLAFNQVGRMLMMKNPNVLYAALSCFARVLYHEKTIINRGSVDSQAIQRYKTQIVKCLDHMDPSIRRRALDVISALIDEHNVETLIPEILSYVKLADSDFRTELVTKIYNASQRFAPSPVWNFDTVHQLIIDSGNYVSSDIFASFCEMVSNSPEIHAHAVAKLGESISQYQDNQCLLQIGAFLVGEFAREPGTFLESLMQIVVLPQTTTETKLYILMAIAKLAVRFRLSENCASFFHEIEFSNHIEVQQRAGELARLLTNPSLAPLVLASMVDTTAKIEQNSVNIHTPAVTSQASDEKEINDLLLLVMDQETQKPTGTLLSDLGMEPSQPQSQPQPQAQAQPVPRIGVQLAETGEYVIFGQVQRNPADPRQCALRLLYYNTGISPLTEVKAEYRVAAGWQIKHDTMDGNVMAPSGGRPLTQIVYLFNQTNTPFSLTVTLKYRYGSQPLSTKSVIQALPE